MNQQDKELLLKDLCTRLPYGIKVETPYNKCYHNCATVIGVVERQSATKSIEYIDIVTNKATYPIKYIKPYLRPMSSMTEKEKFEFRKLVGFNELTSDKIGFLEGGTLEEYISYISFNLMCTTIDWLNAHHFDYRGLIDKGLAIAITEKNNSYKE